MTEGPHQRRRILQGVFGEAGAAIDAFQIRHSRTRQGGHPRRSGRLGNQGSRKLYQNGGNVDEKRGRVLLSDDVCVDISRMWHIR